MDFDKDLVEYLQKNNLVVPTAIEDNAEDNRIERQHRHKHDWYDGYDHVIHHHHRRPRCPKCRYDDLEKYGFELEIGGKYLTGSGKACCPVKVTVTKVTATTVYYIDKNNVEHQKDYHDFMTSSWRDKSL